MWGRGRRVGLWVAVLLALLAACGNPDPAAAACTEFRSVAGAWDDGSLNVAELRERLEQVEDLAAEDPEGVRLAGAMLAAYDDGFDDQALGAAVGKMDRYCAARGS